MVDGSAIRAGIIIIIIIIIINTRQEQNTQRVQKDKKTEQKVQLQYNR